MNPETIAVYKEAIKRYELYLDGKPVNVIDPDGRKPSKREIKKRLFMMQLAVGK